MSSTSTTPKDCEVMQAVCSKLDHHDVLFLGALNLTLGSVLVSRGGLPCAHCRCQFQGQRFWKSPLAPPQLLCIRWAKASLAMAQPISLMPTDSELCPLAKRIPQPRRTGNAVEDSEAMQQHNAFKVIAHVLSKEPSYIIPIHGYLIQLIKKSQDDKDNADVFAQAGSLSKLDADWWVITLVQHSKGKLSIEKVAKMKSLDPDALRRLVVFGMQMPWTAKLPEELKCKWVASHFVQQRLAECGHRLAALHADFISEQGVVNWAHGCYQLKLDDVKATAVSHFDGTEVEVPSWKMITKAFNLNDNHDDALAEVSLQGTTHKLKAFFAEGSGPKSYRTWSPKCTWVKELAAQADKLYKDKTSGLNQNKSKDPSIATVGTIITASTAEKRKAAALKAREALEERQASLAKQRRVSLG